MSATSSQDFPAQSVNLDQRVEHLCQVVSSRVAKAERKRNAYVTVGVCLALVCIVSLSLLTSMAFRLDAQALTQIGRYQVEKSLPSSREAMKEYLELKAPELTGHLLGALMGVLPQLRPIVVREMEAHFDTITSEFETQLVELMESSIGAAKADIDRQFPNLSDAERFELLVSSAASQFNKNMETMLLELYPQYSSEMKRVQGYLSNLKAKDEAQLTPKEKTEKELIETLLKLIAREHAPVAAAAKPVSQ